MKEIKIFKFQIDLIEFPFKQSKEVITKKDEVFINLYFRSPLKHVFCEIY